MTVTQTPRFDETGLGKWTDETRFEVTRERIIEYAKATNDPISAHLAGDVASPVFAIVPTFQSLTEPAIDVVPLQLFGKILHGEQDFRFHRTIKPGETLLSRARMTGFEGMPNGTRACVHAETRGEDGQLVNEQYVTFFVRGFDDGRKLGELSPGHRFDESLRTSDPVFDITQHVDDDQTYRYAPASGDPMPIHLDNDTAKQAGLPGIIAHGFCMLAFTSWAILTELADSDASRLKRLAVRFSKPVLPGQDIRTRAWKASDTTYMYETTVGDDAVLRDGLAVIEG